MNREYGKRCFTETVTDLIYPRRCPVCDRPVLPFGSMICEQCGEELHEIEEPLCRCCGKPVSEGYEYCHDCRTKRHLFVRNRAVYAYRDISSTAYRFKYGSRREYADYLGGVMAEKVTGDRILSQSDILIPVPLSKERYAKRGYNQAELLARKISEKTGIPIRNDILFRNKNTAPLKNMSNLERRSNLKNAFIVYGNDVECKRVLLVDDIYTTGATIDACAKVLLDAGALQVCSAVYAVGVSNVK